MAFLDTRNLGMQKLIKRTFKGFSEDDMSTYAAALAFSILFSMFPFFLFLIALLGFLHLPQFFSWLREQGELFFPPVAMEQINPVIDQLQRQESGLLSFGILLALISASRGVRSLMQAMNVVYAVKEARPIWKLYLLSLVYTVGLAMMMLTAAGLMIVGPQVLEWLAARVGLQEVVITLWTWLRWPAVILLLTFSVAVMYYVMPDVEQCFRFITPGSILAVTIWLIASLGFGIYVQNFANYNATYGSIGAIIVLLLYLYISASVLLFGAEMNAVIEHASVDGKDEGEKIIEE
ncbi:YihY/virulence factor BrkB family protein [Azomonas macrocytogenes]|uniref:Membrane protein n=1 Tax=Azomonas macrocytogenes TaxID=69962 RepID=A0A839T4F8_AZOMA|nr:YihY/virulence factor BrkB family protein [Azomonas macrocytogenes]MBB3103968.1 membrane protein [Azomonas macrocytogenes]